MAVTVVVFFYDSKNNKITFRQPENFSGSLNAFFIVMAYSFSSLGVVKQDEPQLPQPLPQLLPQPAPPQPPPCLRLIWIAHSDNATATIIKKPNKMLIMVIPLFQ